MSRITKEIASRVSHELVREKIEKLSERSKNLESILKDLYMKSLDKKVLEFFHSKERGFMDISRDYCFLTVRNKEDLNRCFLVDGKGLPRKSYELLLVLEEKEFLFFEEEKAKVKKEDDKLTSLQREIETALYALKTYKRIESDFPEAFLLLPSQTSKALSVNLSSLRSKI